MAMLDTTLSFIKDRILIAFLLLMIVIGAFAAPNFLSVVNVRNMLLQSAVLGIVAAGVTFVVINGGIDFSVTSQMSLVTVVGASIITLEGGLIANPVYSIPVAIVVMLSIGLGFGAVNGIAVTRLNMPSFITTLATMMLGQGIATLYTRASTISNLPEQFIAISRTRIFDIIPIPFLLLVAVIVVTQFVLRKTVFGRRMYYIGTNPEVARISGMPVKRNVFRLFLISGICAGLAGAILLSRLASGAPAHGEQFFLDIIVAITIGGGSVLGGKGDTFGTTLGVFFIVIMNTILGLFGVSWFVINIIKGALILLSAGLDSVKRMATEGQGT